MSFIPAYTSQFKKDLSGLEKQQKDIKKLVEVMDLILSGKNIPAKYHPSKLNDNFKNHQQCNIDADWALIYKQEGREVIFERTGSTSDLY